MQQMLSYGFSGFQKKQFKDLTDFVALSSLGENLKQITNKV
jgi:hypothetical protein